MAEYDSKGGLNGVQAKIYKAIAGAASCPWNDLICKRLEVLGPQCLPFDFSSSRGEFCKHAKTVGPSMVTSIIKAFSNSWVTSYRFHETHKLPCIFGCEHAHDKLTHYLQCDPLWTILSSVAGLGAEALSDSPAKRLGLQSPSQTSFILITVASRCYHAIRMDNKALLDRALTTHDFSDVWELLLELAIVFFKDLS